MKTHRIPFLAALLALSALSSLSAQSLTGRVVSPTGQPIADVDVDPGSGNPIGTTDANGIFTISPLPADEYDIEYVPAFGAPWAARMIVTNVVGATNVGDVVLQPGFALSGIARNGAGAPLPGCNINVYAQDGQKLFTPRDGTDVTGNFSVTIPAGTWDVRVLPPVATLIVPQQFEDVVVTTNTSLGTVTLPNGFPVSGTVNDQQTLVPVGSTRIKATNALTGQRVLLTNDTANTFGQWSVLLPVGMFDLDFEPPVGNTHVGKRKYGVLVNGATGLGQVRLRNGVLVSGTVSGPSGPIGGADIDVVDSLGTKIFTHRDVTAATGTFSVAVPAGNGYRVRVQPPPSANLAGATIGPTNFLVSTNLGVVALVTGTSVRGRILGGATGEFDVEMAFFDTLGVEAAVAGNRTDSRGYYITNLLPGPYAVAAKTKEGSNYRDARGQVTISGPKTLVSFTLQPKTLRCTLTGVAVPTLAQNGSMPVDVLIDNRTNTATNVLMDLVVVSPSAGELPIQTGLPLALPPGPLPINGLPVTMPTIPAADLGKVLRLVVRFRDAATTAFLDDASTEFVVE